MKSIRRFTTVALSAALMAGGAAALAPTASAATASSCTYNLADHNAQVDNGINYRSGPGTSYASKGFLYDGDDLRIYCGKGDWYYGKLIYRSKSGMAANTIRDAHNAGSLHTYRRCPGPRDRDTAHPSRPLMPSAAHLVTPRRGDAVPPAQPAHRPQQVPSACTTHSGRIRRQPLSPRPAWQDVFLEPRYDPVIQQEIDADVELEQEIAPPRRRGGRG